MKNAKIGRLAMRHEGDSWNAYYAMPDTMAGAIPLGSIRIGAVVGNPKRKQAFMDMMRDLVGDLIREQTGAAVTWPDGERPAPEHERAGHS